MIYIDPTIGVAMATDADWGRLYKYNTVSDSGLIMPPRSYYLRDFLSGSWTDLAIGMIYCGCGLASDTANMVAERMDETAIANLFHFGLTRSVNSDIDVAGNPNFLGLRGIYNSVTQITTSPLQLASLANTLVKDDNTLTNGSGFTMPFTQGVSGAPFNALGLRFTFDNVNHRIYINVNTLLGFDLANDAENISVMTNFLSAMSNLPGTASANFALNNIVNFKTFYIFWPYILNRLKLQCIGVRKFG